MDTIQASTQSEDIEAFGPKGPLHRILAGASLDRHVVILIIPGSGPTDRDGNNPLGIKAAPYRLLAEALACEGLATVRIDKRGMFANASAVADANSVTLLDYVHDTEAWVAAIRERTGADCVWFLGHSEGGLVALATAARRLAPVCGVILVATPGRPLGEVLKEQLRANAALAACVLDGVVRVIDTLAAGHRVDEPAIPPPLVPLFRPEFQDFLISMLAVDPTSLIRAIDRKILILQGDRDIQVNVADAKNLKAAAPAATLKILPDTNHVLKRVTSDRQGENIATYADPDLPLAPGVADTIARFIKAGTQG